MSKFRILCLAAAFALSASAASPMKKMEKSGIEGWGVGFWSSNDTGGVQLDYKAADREFGLTGNAQFLSQGGSNSWSQFDLGFYGGAKQMVREKLSMSAGFTGTTRIVDQWSNYANVLGGLQTVPYSVGFYAQMSYEPTNYVSLWARSSLWNYEETGSKRLSGSTATTLASSVKTGVSYYFSK
jgi:hypothetical protein